MLLQLAHVLDDESIKAEVAEVVAAEVKYLRFVGLDSVAGRYATEKMVAGVVRLVGEMGADPAHPLRLRFDEFVAASSARLQDDPELRVKGESHQGRAAGPSGAGRIPARPVEPDRRLAPG